MEFNYALYRGKPQDRVFAQVRYRSHDAALQGQFNDPDLHGMHPLTVETPLSRAFELQCRNTVAQ